MNSTWTKTLRAARARRRNQLEFDRALAAADRRMSAELIAVRQRHLPL